MKYSVLKIGLLVSLSFVSTHSLADDEAAQGKKVRDFFNEEHFIIEEASDAEAPASVSGKPFIQNGVRIGPGDDKTGYETTAYKTNSVAITARQGVEADLIRVVDNPPLGLPKIPVPANNPLTEEKIDLGRKLFFDRRLSLNDTFSCAMCHVPEQGFTSHEVEKAVGLEGRSNRRNSPTIYNVAYLERIFLDSRESTLENQVWGPLLEHNEMAMTSMGHLLEKLKSLPDYEGLFEAAFDGKSANIVNVGQALASYQRTLVSGNSDFDRWYFGKEQGVMSEKAIRGFELFRGKAQCITCHTVQADHALFMDNQMHNTGLGFKRAMGKEPEKERMLIAPGTYAYVKKSKRDLVGHPAMADTGFYEVTLDPDDRWKYRTPSLRNVALTAPYMHDGSMPNLEEVIDFYNIGGMPENESGFPNVTQSPLIQPLGLTDAEIDDLIAFLMTLTGDNVAEIISDSFAAPIGDTTNEL